MKKLIIGSFMTLALATGATFYSLSKDNIENVIVCSTNNESSHIPSSICEYYLLNFRGNKSDIDFLNKDAGLGFLVNIDNKPQRHKLFDFFLSKGMEINARSKIDGLTPLHAAILLNDHELVNNLLIKGADINITDRDNHLAASDFLDLLTEKQPKIDRAVIKHALLKQRDKRALTP